MPRGFTTSLRSATWTLRLPGVLVLLLTFTNPGAHGGDASLEYQVKAAFLLRFLNFVE